MPGMAEFDFFVILTGNAVELGVATYDGDPNMKTGRKGSALLVLVLWIFGYGFSGADNGGQEGHS